jgi:hypothetical protein
MAGKKSRKSHASLMQKTHINLSDVHTWTDISVIYRGKGIETMRELRIAGDQTVD